jgi:FAD/FMN-containing dehydrogenase
MHTAWLRRLPLMEGSLLDRTDDAVLPQWLADEAGRLLPVIARPQLGQELEELVAFARSEGLLLVPIGSGSACCAPGLPDDDRPALLVQPGHVALWQGVEEEDGTAWIPAGWTVTEAEAALGRQGYSLFVWPEDGGSLGGNWVMPRGSFMVREFRSPVARRIGCEALLPGYGWMRTSGAPRSAAGPGLARALHGLGAGAALVTQVHVAVRRAADVWTGAVDVSAGQVAGTLETVRRLIVADMGPSALTWQKAARGWRLIWRQRLTNAWADRIVEEAMRALGVDTVGDIADSTASPAWGRLVAWSELAGRMGDRKGTGHFFGALPDGMFERLPRPEPIPAMWARATAGRDPRPVLPRGGTR